MNSPLLRILFAIVNAFGFPGAGTVLAGRTRLGWTQIAISTVLMVATLIPITALMLELFSRGLDVDRLLDIIRMRDSWIFSNREITLFLFGMAAALAYLGNLLWSLTTTKPLAKSTPPPLPPTKS